MSREQHVDVRVLILAGVGKIGTFEVFRGRQTLRAIRRRLKRERAGGDRWARAIVVPRGKDPYVVDEITGEPLDYAAVPEELRS